MEKVVEFETDPELVYPLVGVKRIEWRGRRSVDLTWVSSARPQDYGMQDGGYTGVTLAGSTTEFTVKFTYTGFMEMWMAARAV